jgi:hypothetical protein
MPDPLVQDEVRDLAELDRVLLGVVIADEEDVFLLLEGEGIPQLDLPELEIDREGIDPEEGEVVPGVVVEEPGVRGLAVFKDDLDEGGARPGYVTVGRDMAYSLALNASQPLGVVTAWAWPGVLEAPVSGVWAAKPPVP